MGMTLQMAELYPPLVPLDGGKIAWISIVSLEVVYRWYRVECADGIPSRPWLADEKPVSREQGRVLLQMMQKRPC
jgi:hypothetical protein